MIREKAFLVANMLIKKKPQARIRSIGAYLPHRVVHNSEVGSLIRTSDGELKNLIPRYLETLTGIETRRWADRCESTSSMAYEAAKAALDRAELAPGEIDTLIFAATDTDFIEPATASLVQEKLGIRAVNSFDIKNTCNSVLQALSVVNALIANGACRKGLIVSGEMGSRWINFDIQNKRELHDKFGALTLGDGGAALVVERADDERGFLEFNLTSFAESWRFCHIPHDPDWWKKRDRSIMGWFYLDMHGLASLVKRHVPAYFREYAAYRKDAFGEERFVDHLRCVVPHQISRRFIEMVCQTTRMPLDKTVVTAHRYGNTGATSIPIALNDAVESGKLRLGSGDEIVFFGAASGFSIGHVRLRI